MSKCKYQASNCHICRRIQLDQIKKLATLIARDLFTSGLKRRAERLVMKSADGDFYAGWSERPMAARIEEHLKRALKPTK